MIPYEDGSIDRVMCWQCKHWCCHEKESKCKRFIYENLALIPARPSFSSDVTRGSHIICSDFQPKESTCPDLTRRWTTFAEYYEQAREDFEWCPRVGLFINGDTGTTYIISSKSFVDGTFLNGNTLFYEDKITRKGQRTDAGIILYPLVHHGAGKVYTKVGGNADGECL